MRQLSIGLAALVAVIALIAATRGFGPSGPKLEHREPTGTARFDTGVLLVLSDADMAATGYADNRTRQTTGVRDTLTQLTELGANAQRREQFVSNSVVGWPGASVTSHDGHYLYVVENQGEIADDVDVLDDPYTASPGQSLTTIRLDGNAAPVIRPVCANPSSVSIMPDNSALLVSCLDANTPLVWVSLDEGVPVTIRPLTVGGGVESTSERKPGYGYARLSPDGRLIAATIGDRVVRFLQVDPNGTSASILGEDLVFEDGWLSMGRWSADSRHWIQVDVGWGPGPLDAVLNSAGRLMSIRPAASGTHEIVSQVYTSLSPEGVEFAPDGSTIAVANMERSYLPHGLPFALFKRSKASSLSLVSFDEPSGALAVADGPVRMDAILPEDVMFDDDGDALAVVSYQDSKKGVPQNAWLEIYAIDDGARIRPTGQRVELVRGAHDMEIVRRR